MHTGFIPVSSGVSVLAGGSFVPIGLSGGGGGGGGIGPVVLNTRPLIADTRRMEGCAIAASSTASSDFAASNVVSEILSRSWRPAASDAAPYLDFALTAKVQPNVVALLVKASPWARFRIKGARRAERLDSSPDYTSAWSSDLDYDAERPTLAFDLAQDEYTIGGSASGAGFAAERGFVLRYLLVEPGEAYRHWRVEIDDPCCFPAGAPEIGHVLIADAWRPTRAQGYGWSVGIADDSVKIPSQGGALHVDAHGIRRVLTFEIGYLPGEEALEHGLGLFRRAGRQRPVLAIMNPHATGHAARWDHCFGMLEELTPVVNPYRGLRHLRFHIPGQHA